MISRMAYTCPAATSCRTPARPRGTACRPTQGLESPDEHNSREAPVEFHFMPVLRLISGLDVLLVVFSPFQSVLDRRDHRRGRQGCPPHALFACGSSSPAH